MEETYDSLRWYDYLIFVTAVCISLGIGIYYAVSGDKQRTTKEYLLGDRKMSVFPVAVSQFATGISGVLLLGAPAEFYNYGITSYINIICISVSWTLAAFIIIPTFYGLEFVTANKYLEARFNTPVLRLASAALATVSRMMSIGLDINGPASSLEAVSGFPFWASVLATGVVATIYSSIGGLKGVVGTDVFQGLMMQGGALLVLILGTMKVGSISEVWSIASENGRFDMNFTASPLVRISFWSALLGTFAGHFTSPTGQTYNQRIVSMKNKKAARNYFLLTIPQIVLMYTLCYMSGMVAFAYYYKEGCDPLQTDQISSSNQIFPFFLMNGLRIPGIPGLFIAMLFCSVLSSISSNLNAMAAITWKDFLEPYCMKNISEFQKATVNKILVVIFGGLGIGFAFMFSYIHGNFMQMTWTVFSAFNGPIDGVYLLGLFCPWVEYKAAVVGLIGGFALAVSITIGANMNPAWREVMPTNIDNCTQLGFNNTVADYGQNVETNPLFMVSFQYYSTISIFTTVAIALIVSLFIREKSPVNPRYLAPVGDRLFCCLPKKLRYLLNCRVDHSDYKRDCLFDHSDGKREGLDTKMVNEEPQKHAVFNVQVSDAPLHEKTAL